MLIISQQVFVSSIWQKNTLIAGAVTGAVMSAVNKNNKDKILTDAIVGGAVATAASFVRNFITGK